MLSINLSELIWTIINFFLLYFVLKRFLFDPVCSFMDARQAKIDAGLNAEKQARETVEQNREKLAAEKAEARIEASRILSEAEQDAEKRHAEVLSAARVDAAEKLKAGQTQLAGQSTLDEKTLEKQSGELSALLTQRILG